MFVFWVVGAVREPPLRVLCKTTVIPAKAGIQRDRATASKAKRQVQTPFRSLCGINGEDCAAPLRVGRRNWGGRLLFERVGCLNWDGVMQ